MTRVLITGASGFVGKNVVECLMKEKEFEVVAYVMSSDLFGRHQLETIGVKSFVDESNLSLFSDTIDYCIHLASYGVKYGARDLSTMIDVNVKFTTEIMGFCAKHGCRLFVNTGSCFEYGSLINSRPIKESDSLSPDDIYAASKVACEDILRVYSKLLGIKYITIRPFSIYGKYEPDGRIMPLVFEAGMCHTTLKLTAGGQIRDYMDVRMVAYCIMRLIQEEEKVCSGEAINICAGNPISLKDFIKLMIQVCSFDPSLFQFGEIEYRSNESMFFVGDNSRLKEIIGIKEFGGLERSIFESYQFYKSSREKLTNN